MTLFSTSFVVAPHCTEGMPFAMGIPLGEMGVSNAKASRKVMSLSIFISCLFLSVLTHPRPIIILGGVIRQLADRGGYEWIRKNQEIEV
jgi:hypothetical protein